MGVLGISLIAATVILFCFRPPAWLSVLLRNIQQSRLGPPPQPPLIREPEDDDETEISISRPARPDSNPTITKDAPTPVAGDDGIPLRRQAAKAETDRFAMPPPPPPSRPPVIVQQATEMEEEPRTADSACEEQTTPRASAVMLNNDPIPQLALSVPTQTLAPPSSPPNIAAPPAPKPSAPSPSAGLMPPPPRPVPSSLLRPHQPGTSTLPLPRSSGPLPNRSPGASPSSSLFPPPTHTTKPAKPSKQIALQPGHSPLDWARLTADPSANLRGLPRDAPYIRVTPSMLKRMTGRKGKDAWTVLGGRVYNMTPYIPFHPGGEPELLRAAGRDGNKLFGEIHPWVNYEGMLAACLIGIYVPEEEAVPGVGGDGNGRSGPEYDMEAMD